MNHRPICLWFLSELLQDCRWQGTFLVMLPIEILIKILQLKWKMEREAVRKHLKLYIKPREGHLREMRSVTYFQFYHLTPNRINVNYLLKWGPGFINKDIKFTKRIKIDSHHIQYDFPIMPDNPCSGTLYSNRNNSGLIDEKILTPRGNSNSYVNYLNNLAQSI